MTRDRPRPRVLIVDDDPITLRICEITLTSHAIEVVTARTGQAAAALEDPAFDLIVVDLHMPGLNGWDTVTAMRARQQHAGVAASRFVMLTTDDAPAVRARCRSMGIEEHLIKPAGIQRLTEIARALIDP